jgi:hypothetical protein
MNRILVLISLCLPPAAVAGSLLLSGKRDPWLWPFASNSIWNQPIGSEARYVPAGLMAQGGFGIDEEILLRVAPDAPGRPLFAPKLWELSSEGYRLWAEAMDPALQEMLP